MKELGERLRRLRESVKLSQVKMAELLGVKQSSINRYEQGQSAPSLETLVRYADYFDVSLDYLLARTDNPQGKLYEHRPKIAPGSEEMKQFIEMCFDPQSPLNEKLKQTLLEMMEMCIRDRHPSAADEVRERSKVNLPDPADRDGGWRYNEHRQVVFAIRLSRRKED